MSSFSRWIVHPWLTIRVQIGLGVIFVVASLPKIIDPPSFAQMIYNYRILPGVLINPVALVLPWFELLTGVALILGIWRRTAAIFIGAMLVVFIVGIGINLARDNPVNCGCFDLASAEKPREVLLGEMKSVLVRDVAMLFLVAQILAATAGRERASAENRNDLSS